MRNKLNVGVIGLGVGARHAQTLYSNKKVNLISLCDFDNNISFLFSIIFPITIF